MLSYQCSKRHVEEAPVFLYCMNGIEDMVVLQTAPAVWGEIDPALMDCATVHGRMVNSDQQLNRAS